MTGAEFLTTGELLEVAAERLLSWVLAQPTTTPRPPAREDVIADPLWREAVQRWNAGESARAIGQRLGWATKTVANRIGELRRAYPEAVLTDRQRRQRGLNLR